MMKTKNIILLTLTMAVMTGCAQMTPKVQRGALIGAGTGAVITAVTGSSVLTGAAIGAVVGGGLEHIRR